MTRDLGMVVNFFTNFIKPDTRRAIIATTELSLRLLRLNPDVGRIILVDGSRRRDELMEEACRNLEVEYYHHGHEISYVQAYNIGWRMLKEPYIGLMANDIIPHPITSITELLEWVRLPDVGSVHPYFASNRHGGDETQRVGFWKRGDITCEPSSFTLNLNLFKRSVLEQIGGLDENYLSAFAEPILLLKIRSLGCRVIMVGGAKVFHYDRLTKSLNESNLNMSLYQADVIRWMKEHHKHASKNPHLTPIAYWKSPFTTTISARCLWWLAFHIPIVRVRSFAMATIMWIEPVLTRYPAKKHWWKRSGHTHVVPHNAGRVLARHILPGTYEIKSAISEFLMAPFAEFYEDGWVGKVGNLQFLATGASEIELAGEFPVWSKLEQMTIRCNGGIGDSKVESLKPGNFKIRLKLPPNRSKHQIHLECNRVFQLPAPDGRKAGILVKDIRVIE